MHKPNEIQQLSDTVIKGGYCIGCGACALAKGSPFDIKIDEYGNYIAFENKSKKFDVNAKVLNTCPFSGVSKNENELGEIFFPESNHQSNHIGNYLKCFAGHVSEGNYRSKGSSGGFGKWLGKTLLEENEVDYFVQVVGNSTGKANVPLFDYKVFSDFNEVLIGSKSSYYPTTLEGIVKFINNNEGRYAITGVPCFIKAIRLLSLENSVLAERIRFTIGIVCGGMKTANQSKMIGWQLGIHPNNLTAIDFRGKDPSMPATSKIYKVWSDDNTVKAQLAGKIHGTDYGASFFKPYACDYCDDVVGETADVSLGDAWLPQYIKDSGGTSIIVIRNQKILEIIERFMAKGTLSFDEVEGSDVIKSQEGGFRHRREALSYRLGKKELRKEWYPEKRVLPNEFVIEKKRKKIYQLREDIARQSHIFFLEAIKRDDFNYFLRKMLPIERRYFNLVRGTKIQRGIRKVHKIVNSIFSR